MGENLVFNDLLSVCFRIFLGDVRLFKFEDAEMKKKQPKLKVYK